MSQTTTAATPPPASRPILRQLQCPKCNTSIPQFAPDAQTLTCPACHSTISEGMEGLIASPGSKLPNPRVPIKVGQQFTLDGVNFFVLGRVVYKGWEPDDTSDNWTWNEWLLGGSDGRLLWLSLDEHGLMLFNKLRIREAFDPAEATAIPVGNGEFARVTERYPARVMGVEGELTWRAKRGDNLTMIEGVRFDKKYSVQATASEIEIHEGTKLDTTRVKALFGEEASRSAASAGMGLGREIGIVAIGFAILALILAFVVSGTGNLIAEQTVQASKTLEGSFPVEFTAPGRPVILKLTSQTDLPENTVADLDVSVMSPDESETFVTFQDFWHETGVDEGEAWREQRLDATDTFVPFLAGMHTVNVGLDETSQIETLSVRVEIRDQHISPTYLLGYSAMLGVIGLVLVFTGKERNNFAVLFIIIVIIIVGVLIASGIDMMGLLGDIFSEL
jgi:hypothetical protein